MTTDNIDVLAQTDRQRIVAKVLTRLYSDDPQAYVVGAQAVLLALDEHESDVVHEFTAELVADGYTAEQEARADAVLCLSHVLSGTSTRLGVAVDMLLEQAGRVADYIRDGQVGEP